MEINMAKKQQLRYEVYYDDNVNGDWLVAAFDLKGQAEWWIKEHLQSSTPVDNGVDIYNDSSKFFRYFISDSYQQTFDEDGEFEVWPSDCEVWTSKYYWKED